MELETLIHRFSSTCEGQQKAIFNTLFIVGNRLQTIFDARIPDITLKQFMLLSLLRQLDEQPTLTALGEFLGCSRQNIKKLAQALAQKGYVKIQASPDDPRAKCVAPTEKLEAYFREDFAPYQAELRHLFAVYTEEELEMLFHLLMKMYDGIENLEKKAIVAGS